MDLKQSPSGFSNTGSDAGTVIEESDLADHFDSQQRNDAQEPSWHQSPTPTRKPALWSHSPVYPGLVTSPSLSFQTHLSPYSNGISASPIHMMNRQMMEEAKFLSSFIPQPNHDIYYQDPFDNLNSGDNRGPELFDQSHQFVPRQDWDRILAERESFPGPSIVGQPSAPWDSEDHRLETILLSNQSTSEQEAMTLVNGDQDVRWEEAMKSHFLEQLGSPERLHQTREPTQVDGGCSPPIDYQSQRVSPRRAIIDHRGRIKLGNSTMRVCLRALQALGSLLGLATLALASIIIHPNPKPTQLMSLEAYLYYLVSFLSLSLCVWRVSMRVCTGPDQPTRIQSDYPDNSWCCGGRKRTERDMRRRIAMGEYCDHDQRNAPQPISVNFIVDGRLFAGISPDIAQSPNAIGKSQSPLQQRFESSVDPRQCDSDELLKTPLVDSLYGLDNITPKERYLYRQKWSQKAWELKKDSAIDILSALIWLAWSIWTIGFKDRCPVGGFQGWCNAYNTSIAIAVILALSFAASAWITIRLIVRNNRACR